MNSSQVTAQIPQTFLAPQVLSNLVGAGPTSSAGVQVANVTEQLKGLSLQNQPYASVGASQTVAGNKENTKKMPNESQISHAAGSKVSLKAREFGREITNASASSAATTGLQGAKQANSSVIIESSAGTTSSQSSQGSSSGPQPKKIPEGGPISKIVKSAILSLIRPRAQDLDPSAMWSPTWPPRSPSSSL